MNTVHDGTRVVGLAILNDLYPNIPHINNFSEAQGVNANIYFTLGWDGMNGGTLNDYIQLRIEDSAGDKVFETPDFGKPGALNGTVTTVMMTPGTLEPGHAYSATLRFQKNTTLNTANYPGAIGAGSYFTRTSFPIITSAAGAPDVASYEITKSRSFVQSDAGAAVPDLGKEYTFDAKVNGQKANSILSGSVTTPAGNVVQLMSASDNQDFEYSQSAASSGLLDSLFLAGQYTITLATAHDGTKSSTLSLPSADYPPVPHLLNLETLQTIRGDFTVSWDPWPGGRDTDFIQLRIEDNDGTTVFKTPDFAETDALNGHATGTMVAGTKLIPGKSYRARLMFHRIVAIDTTSYAGVLGFASFYSKTKFDLQPAPPDVKTASVLKGHEFVQNNQGPPAPNISTAFVFTATVTASDAGTVNGVRILTPRGTSAAAVLETDGKTFTFRDGCDDQIQIDAAYPEGIYTLQIDTAHDGLREVRLRLNGALYPNAPHLSDFSRTRLVQSDNALILNWDLFTGGTTNDFIYLDFANNAGIAVYNTKSFGKSSALNGNDAAQVIPNGTFQESQLYHGSLLFQKTITTDATAYPGADSWSGYFSRTRFTLTTAGPGNPPILASWSLAGNGALSFTVTGLKGATYRIDCSSDLKEWVPLGTFTAFDGQTRYTDPSPATRPCFFYRAMLSP